jgi:hypothetical protein
MGTHGRGKYSRGKSFFFYLSQKKSITQFCMHWYIAGSRRLVSWELNYGLMLQFCPRIHTVYEYELEFNLYMVLDAYNPIMSFFCSSCKIFFFRDTSISPTVLYVTLLQITALWENERIEIRNIQAVPIIFRERDLSISIQEGSLRLPATNRLIFLICTCKMKMGQSQKTW